MGIKFSHSPQNIGLCSGSNSAARLAKTDYIIYSNDDMYFLPNWDFFLVEELKKIKNNMYFFTGTTIGPIGCALTGGVEIEKLSEDDFKNFLDFGVSTTPTVVVIDREGIVRLYNPGDLPYDELSAHVERLL